MIENMKAIAVAILFVAVFVWAIRYLMKRR